MSVQLEVDSRWRHFVVTFPDGGFSFWTEQLLDEQLTNWADNLPQGLSDVVAHHLAQSRSLIRHAWYRYEFLPIAARAAYEAIELHLRDLLGSKARFETLISRAAEKGFLSQEEADRLQGSRLIRNELTHPSGTIIMTPDQGLGSVRIGHLTVARLGSSRRLPDIKSQKGE